MEYLWCVKLNAPASVAVCKNINEACHQVTKWRWMLCNNISRNGYGNAMIGRYGGCFEEEYLVLCVGEQSPPTGFWMHWRSLHQLSMWERAMHSTEEASKYGWWKCQEPQHRTHELKDYNKQIILQGIMQITPRGFVAVTSHCWLPRP